MNIADEFKKLQELRESGTLSEEEFAAAKARVLAAEKLDNGPAMDAHFDLLRRQNDVDRLDREWAVEREQYMLRSRHGQRYVPNRTMGIVVGVVAVVFGIYWMSMAMSSKHTPGFLPFFGLIPIAVGIGMAIYTFQKANQYEEAFARYQRRRARLLEDPFDDRYSTGIQERK